MLINNLADVKELIQNNIELFRLHDFMSRHWSANDVQNVARGSHFNHRRIVWYTEINSLYSSIVIVKEYMATQGDALSSLDLNFTMGSWYIHSAREFDANNTTHTVNITLATVLRRMRNSIGHGKFQITPVGTSATSWLATFNDEDVRQPNAPNRFFELQIVAVDLPKFLEQLERCFNQKYP